MTPLEMLVKARALISDKSKWTQVYCARDKSGVPCNIGQNAVSWCAIGALAEITIDRCEVTALLRLSRASYLLFNKPLINVNDELGHEAIMDVYDWAIKQLQPVEVKVVKVRELEFA